MAPPRPSGSNLSTTPYAPWRAVAWAQAAYYAFTGLWPLVHIDSFLAVTGPKVEVWLVQFFGALVCVPGAVAGWAAWSGRLDRGSLTSAIGALVVLGVGDVLIVARRAVGPIYLVDAAVEAVLLIAWGCALAHMGEHRSATSGKNESGDASRRFPASSVP